MPYLTAIDGTQLHYTDVGSGTPVVFLHSWALSSQMWRYQMLDLAERGHRCIAMDRRGHGLSEKPWDGYNFDSLADDLAVLIEHLDLRGIVLVGHSTGTGEVVRYLTRHGSDRISQAVLAATITPLLARRPDYPQGLDPANFDQMRVDFRADLPNWAARIAGPFFGLDLPEVDISEAQVAWSINDTHTVSPRAMIELSYAMSETDFRAELPRIDVPTLVVHGLEDLFNPFDLCAKPTASLIPEATLAAYEHGPHGLHLTHRDRLTRDLADFITA